MTPRKLPPSALAMTGTCGISMKDRCPQKAIPIGTILTVPAAGSESSDSSVMTNEEIDHKRSCDNRLLYPKFSI